MAFSRKTSFSIIFIFLFLLGGALCYRYLSVSDHIFKKYEHELAVCAIFQNEAPYLKEWIDYHHEVLGATYFYLYDNESTDDYRTVLQPYIDQGIVEVIPWSSTEEHAIEAPEVCSIHFVRYQIGAYTDCCKNRALGKVRWLSVHDIDEFVVPVGGIKAFKKMLSQASRPSIKKFLKNPFQSVRMIGCLKMNWLIFGTSHIWDLEEDQGVTDALTLRAPDDFLWNLNTKCIYRPEAINLCYVHNALLHKEKYQSKHIPLSKCRVNHYYTGPEKRLIEKRNPSPELLSEFSIELNVVEDLTLINLKQ